MLTLAVALSVMAAAGARADAATDPAATAAAAGIAIDVTGPATATAGELVTFDLTVRNSGGTAFAEAAVKVTATAVAGGACATAPSVPKSRGGDATPGSLDPGDAWVYQCQVQTAAGDARVATRGDVSAADGAGATVTATDTAETPVTAPAARVSPAEAVSGRARLTGSVGCVASRFARASVSGTAIEEVAFVVNGTIVKTLRRPNAGTAYELRYRTATLAYGSYRVRARIRFATTAVPRTRTLDLQFSRCRPRAVRPTFTG